MHQEEVSDEFTAVCQLLLSAQRRAKFAECTYTSHAMSPITSIRLHNIVCRTHGFRYRGYIHDVSTGGTSMKTQAKIARCAAIGVPQNMVCCMHIRTCEFPTIAQYRCACWMDTEQWVLPTHHHRCIHHWCIMCVYIYIYIRRYPPMSATTRPVSQSSTESWTGATTGSGDVSSCTAWSNKRRACYALNTVAASCIHILQAPPHHSYRSHHAIAVN